MALIHFSLRLISPGQEVYRNSPIVRYSCFVGRMRRTRFRDVMLQSPQQLPAQPDGSPNRPRGVNTDGHAKILTKIYDLVKF